MPDWVVGQRCASKGEPALGLGIITEVSKRNLRVAFPASSTVRTYAKDKAPLRRVAFEAGERVWDNDGHSFTVVEVKEQDGLLYYLGEDHALPETELNHAIIFSRPHQKLLAGQVNKPHEFLLRRRAWEIKNACLAASCRGLMGPRIELLAHQLYIAEEVARRHHPRVLLSDEVGLGKTIEAGLIFHRQLITGEVRRVLVLAPGALVHQWLTELYRRFNVLFNIMSPKHATELDKTHPGMNPYLAHQCVLQDLAEAAADDELGHKLQEVEWDLVIVDEAHHLFWSPRHVSPEYRLVEGLAAVCGGLLLLTATPRQLGLESHFGRLKLLDPDRFESFEKFQEENRRYIQLAGIADRSLQGKGQGVREEISELFPGDRDLIAMAPDRDGLTGEPVLAFIRALIDRHGTGRMVYRNRRKVLSGFPKRKVIPVPLPTSEAYQRFVAAGMKILHDTEIGQSLLAGAPAFKANQFKASARETRTFLKRAWQEDPRLAWLLALLRENPEDKFLLICSRKAVVLALQEWFGLAKDIDVVVFHEELNILERDRQAAYFAKPNGARLLLSSEIGSEGRNFQFAHKLILFDLPLNPALLEQRIGRLDRIGQHHDIEIYIPHAEGSPLDYLFQWYHHGLDAFENHLLEGDYIYEHLRQRIFTVFKAVEEPDIIEPFIEESRAFCHDLRKTIQKGRDRLLEIHSFDKGRGEALVREIQKLDGDLCLKAFMDDLFEWCGINVEDQEQVGTQIVKPSPQMFVESFPGLPEEGLEITYNRDLAVFREELAFLSYDHPMVAGALDLYLGLERGVTSFAIWKKAPEPGMLLECQFVLESQGGDELRLGRYLPPVPIRVTVDQNKRLRPDLVEPLSAAKLDHGPVTKLHQQRQALTQIVESLTEVAEEEAQRVAGQWLEKAEHHAMYSLKDEYVRLKALLALNPSVREEELDFIEERLNFIIDHLEESRPRFDAVRLIMMVP